MMRPDMQSGAAAATTTVGVPAPEKTATEEQARAIIRAAQRAVEEAKGGVNGGGAGGLSLKKSLEWFLEGRKNKGAAAARIHHRHLEDSSSSSN